MLIQLNFQLPGLWVALCLLTPWQQDLPGVEARLEASDESQQVAGLQAFFGRNCIRCHGPERPRGGMRLDLLAPEIQTETDAEAWQEVLDVLNGSMMPPEDEPQPKQEELIAAITTLTEGLHAGRQRLQRGGGVVLRRLNKREYRNTIHDLLGVWVSTVDLLEDGHSGGFDTVGEAHALSALHYKRYLDLGEQALAKALKPPQRGKPQRVRIQPEVERGMEAAMAGSSARAMLANPNERQANNPSFRRRFELIVAGAEHYKSLVGVEQGAILGSSPTPFVKEQSNEVLECLLPSSVPGTYVVKFRAGLTRASDAASKGVFLSINQLDGKGLEQKTFNPLGTVLIDRPLARGAVHSFTFERSLDGEDLIELRLAGSERNGASAVLGGESNREEGLVCVDWIEIEGPLRKAKTAPLWGRIFFNGLSVPPGDEDAYAKQIIRRFAFKAFRRRKAAPEYVDALLGLYRKQRTTGLSFTQSTQKVLAVVLASPGFLYLVEDAGEVLDQRELACRLAYFLWSSPPDKQLYDLVERGELTQPKVLREQLERMLVDARSAQFVEAFVTQWLELDRLDMIVVNARFESFTEDLRRAFKAESIGFMRALIDADLPASNLIDSDFVWVDRQLAEHYGLEVNFRSGFHKVLLPAGSARGGILGQAAILTLNGTGDLDSPVERGVFIRRKLLATPPPPPPPNVPQIEFERAGSMREQIALHTSQAQCVACHRGFDPMGFGLQGFDAVGAWRSSQERSLIDLTGAMPDGQRRFDGHRELKQFLLQDLDAMAKGLMRSLLTYATGRRIGWADEPQLQQLSDQWKAAGYNMRELLHIVVQSEAFRSN